MARWGRILDRIEFRQAAVGLRFWGPPLWLEVTMTGPDSDLWPANPEGNHSYNWLSTEVCLGAERLFAQGADDDQLVAEVGRYTIENLILNAVHEIGEWLRFDGLRVFPAHPPSGGPLGNSDGQGNGSVQLTVTFDPPARPSPVFLVPPPVDDLMEIANPSRFTYLPGTSVEYHADGPEIRFRTGDAPTTGWRSTWSPATLDSLRDGADAETLIGAVRSDVHRAVVASEADRICRAFYIDRRRPWRLSAADPRVAAPPIGDDEADGILDLTIAYLNPDVYIG